MKQNDREIEIERERGERKRERELRRRGGRSYASRVYQATPGSRGWLDTTAAAIAIAVANVDSRSMIPVTALPSRALVGTGGLRVISLGAGQFYEPGVALRCGTPGVALSRP